MPHKVNWSVHLQIWLSPSQLRSTVCLILTMKCAQRADCIQIGLSCCLAYLGYYISGRTWDERRQMMSLVNLQLYFGFSRNAIWKDHCCIHLPHCFISADTFKTQIDPVLTKAEDFLAQAHIKRKPKSMGTIWLVILCQIKGVFWFLSAVNGDKRPNGREI